MLLKRFESWLDMLTNTKRGRRPVREGDGPLTTTAQNINNEDPRDGRAPRDASMSDEEEETGLMHMIPLHWVPYVHFGV